LGIAYLARRADGAVLLETRPDRGLLGGMLGWPGTDWAEAAPQDAPPLPAHWHDPSLEVRHTFTHFHLRLALRLAIVPADAAPDRGMFHDRATFRPSSLPTVMRKAWDLAQGAWPED
jgi:A/G-specific adenine glycosylase